MLNQIIVTDGLREMNRLNLLDAALFILARMRLHEVLKGGGDLSNYCQSQGECSKNTLSSCGRVEIDPL